VSDERCTAERDTHDVMRRCLLNHGHSGRHCAHGPTGRRLEWCDPTALTVDQAHTTVAVFMRDAERSWLVETGGSLGSKPSYTWMVKYYLPRWPGVGSEGRTE